MIAIGIIGLCLVAGLWVLLYFYFLRRTDRFMDNWEKEIKEKAEKATQESLQMLQEAANALEASVENVQSLHEASEAIKASRQAMERFAFEKGFIPKLPAEEIKVSAPITEPQLETMPNSSSSFQFDPYPARKHEERENLSPSNIRLVPSPI
jgi:hypothetical protein